MPSSPVVNSPRSPQVAAPRGPAPYRMFAGIARAAATREEQRNAKRIEDIAWTYTPQSSWVAAFRYFTAKLLLDIMFKSGAICRYAGISPDRARTLKRAGSKGKWVWRWVYYWPYTLIKAGKRSAKRKRRGRSR